MINQPDSDGRYPLSGREYGALKTMFGAVNALDTEELDSRCKLQPNSLRDIHAAKALLQKSLFNLLDTVPLKKLGAIRKELQNTYCILKTKPVGGGASDHTVYVDQKALIRLMERAISMDCFLCEKSVKEGRKCPLYRDLSACFPYNLDDSGDVLCPFAGVSSLQLEE